MSVITLHNLHTVYGETVGCHSSATVNGKNASFAIQLLMKPALCNDSLMSIYNAFHDNHGIN